MAGNNVGHENQPLYSAFNVANKTVATGTADAIAASTACGLVMLRSRKANTATVFIGSSASLTVSNGVGLEPGESTGWLPINNLNLIFAISGTAAQVLEIIYL
jgi:hypothetical protein